MLENGVKCPGDTIRLFFPETNWDDLSKQVVTSSNGGFIIVKVLKGQSS